MEGNVLQEYSRRWARFLVRHGISSCARVLEVAGSREECGEDGGSFATP